MLFCEILQQILTHIDNSYSIKNGFMRGQYSPQSVETTDVFKEKINDLNIRLLPKIAAENKIHLTSDEIQLLIDIAIYHPITLTINKRCINLLLLLIELGTVQKSTSHTTNICPILGKRDARIEKAIIDNAINKQTNIYTVERREVIFGLSGNPPTLAHGLFIQHLTNYFDKVHIMLNAQSPLKNQQTIAAEDRYSMLVAMLNEQGISTNNCCIQRLEIDRLAPSRMIASLSALILLSKVPTHYTLALGYDALSSFHKWYQFENFHKLCALKFYPRKGHILSPQSISESILRLIKTGLYVTLVLPSKHHPEDYQAITNCGVNIVTEDLNLAEVSSSAIREFYNKGNRGIPLGISPQTHKFILERGIYSLCSK